MNRVAIERKSGLSLAEFARDHLSGLGTPVVLTDATKNWPALSKWTFQYFRDRYGSQFALAPSSLKGDASKVTKIATYLDYLDTPADLPGFWLDREGRRPVKDQPGTGVTAPYLMGWHAFREHPELYDDISPAPHFIDDFVTSFEPVVRDVFQFAAGRDYWSVFIGPAGSLSELHQDYWSTHAYLAQIQGRKRAMLFSPSDTPRLYDGKVDPSKPDLTRHPLIDGATAHECEFGPGDMLFIPSNWWHWVQGLEKSITVSHNFFNHGNFSEHMVALVRKTPRLIEALDVVPEWRERLHPRWKSNGFVEE